MVDLGGELKPISCVQNYYSGGEFMNTVRMLDMVNSEKKANNVILQKNTQATTNKAALYLRLSRDDKDGDFESVSIQNQRLKLTDYADEKGFNIVDFYVDDGCSGTNFERPAFKRLIQDIERGHIDVVLAKDLSRFGRNYAMSSFYREYFLNEFGVRVITVDENFDSSDEDNEIAPFLDVINEHHARQTSKKTKSIRRMAAKKGLFMGSTPPYGYRRSEIDKHLLVVDEEAAAVVRRIFELFRGGESARHIGDMLNKEGVTNPQKHYYDYLGKPNPYKNNAKSWSSATISVILRRETYLGHMVQGMSRVQSFKTKHIVPVPSEEWIRVENTHEPIVDSETFNAVQQILKVNYNCKPKRTSINDEPSLFSNLLRCKDCGSKLNFNSSVNRGEREYVYRCAGYIQNNRCKPHRINLELLTSVVLGDIKRHAKLANEDEEAFIRQLHLASSKDQAAEVESFKKKIKATRAEIEKIDELVLVAFEKLASNVLSDDIVKNLTEGYMAKKGALETELPTLIAALEIAENRNADRSNEIANLKRYSEITELTREVLSSLVQTVFISEPEKKGKEKFYDMEIRYRFHNPYNTWVRVV